MWTITLTESRTGKKHNYKVKAGSIQWNVINDKLQVTDYRTRKIVKNINISKYYGGFSINCEETF